MTEYKTRGTCSTKIRFEIEDGMIRHLTFENGCNGNGKAVALLVEGRDAEDIARLLEGVVCHGRETSCADQLAKAIRAEIQKIK